MQAPLVNVQCQCNWQPSANPVLKVCECGADGWCFYHAYYRGINCSLGINLENGTTSLVELVASALEREGLRTREMDPNQQLDLKTYFNGLLNSTFSSTVSRLTLKSNQENVEIILNQKLASKHSMPSELVTKIIDSRYVDDAQEGTHVFILMSDTTAELCTYLATVMRDDTPGKREDATELQISLMLTLPIILQEFSIEAPGLTTADIALIRVNSTEATPLLEITGNGFLVLFIVAYQEATEIHDIGGHFQLGGIVGPGLKSHPQPIVPMTQLSTVLQILQNAGTRVPEALLATSSAYAAAPPQNSLTYWQQVMESRSVSPEESIAPKSSVALNKIAAEVRVSTINNLTARLSQAQLEEKLLEVEHEDIVILQQRLVQWRQIIHV